MDEHIACPSKRYMYALKLYVLNSFCFRSVSWDLGVILASNSGVNYKFI